MADSSGRVQPIMKLGKQRVNFETLISSNSSSLVQSFLGELIVKLFVSLAGVHGMARSVVGVLRRVIMLLTSRWISERRQLSQQWLLKD